ncbi:uncharacterized protein ARMOST_13620 [Armillaria ostoyae]|uniref:Uncharacterized protein n=1 Tax=Armillaria ostoyae TaxID=47428 RepID=A0A284RN89_ARMOS|nr:uncharacterized protein ARMOST_13620 [Armillaria ostoyae]
MLRYPIPLTAARTLYVIGLDLYVTHQIRHQEHRPKQNEAIESVYYDLTSFVSPYPFRRTTCSVCWEVKTVPSTRHPNRSLLKWRSRHTS